MADKESDKKPSLDKAPPAPPEMRVRPALSGIVASRDAEQGGQAGAAPGMGGPNAIATKAMAAEQAIGELMQVSSNPAPFADLVARLRAAVVSELQSAGGPAPSPGPMGMAGMAPPPMGGAPTGAPPMAGGPPPPM